MPPEVNGAILNYTSIWGRVKESLNLQVLEGLGHDATVRSRIDLVMGLLHVLGFSKEALLCSNVCFAKQVFP